MTVPTVINPRTSQSGISLGSDNHSGVHPKIMQSIMSVNEGHVPSYDSDPLAQKLKTKIKELFGQNFESYLCFNGTAANVICLKTLLKSYQATICSDVAHIHHDECAAPENLAHTKLITVKSKNGKIYPEDIEAVLVRKGDQHHVQIKALSITQPTELGTVYSFDEIKSLSDFCDKQNLYLHIDGSRISQAANYLKTDFKTLCKEAHMVSLGGTKNGLLFGELILFNKERFERNAKNSETTHLPDYRDIKYYRKQLLQLPSKTRFMASQWLTYLNGDLYKEISSHVHDQAKKLENLITKELSWDIAYPVQSNAVFVKVPKHIVKALKKEVFFYIWDESTYMARLMTSFDTTTSHLEYFVQKAKELSSSHGVEKRTDLQSI